MLPDRASKQGAYTEERRRYWDEAARDNLSWGGPHRAYHRRLSELYRFVVPPGARVLELGCASGDLLVAVAPDHGVGVDFSSMQIERARANHPQLTFHVADAHSFDLGETFDYILASDLINDLWDVQQVFETARRHAHPGTRVVMNFYSRLWEAPRRIAETLRFARPLLSQNWFTVPDVSNLLNLAGFETIHSRQEIMWPFRTPLIDSLANRYLVKLPPFSHLGLTNLLVARPSPEATPDVDARVSVVVPARNEAGNIAQIFDRVPEMGAGTELIFVEGNSKDDTADVIQREIARHPDRDAKFFRQRGKGKGDAVRLGFAEATGGVLMILDADLTVPPEDLPRFYEAWRSGKGEFINGVRLVYPMEGHAMRFFNFLGNKFFSLAFSWLLNQSIKDTLCGTKVLSASAYQVIARNRAYFGEFDPFGDFDLIFGAARYNMKIVDLPIRYGDRTYGETNINRWSHGWLLLRMVVLAMRRIKFV